MTYEEKAEIVISQLRADQDRLQDALDKMRAEIEALNPVDYVSMSSYDGHKGASDMKHDVLQIIDKYRKREK